LPLRSNLREVNLARDDVGWQKPPHACVDRQSGENIPESKTKV
jgi:hypothetical protein